MNMNSNQYKIKKFKERKALMNRDLDRFNIRIDEREENFKILAEARLKEIEEDTSEDEDDYTRLDSDLIPEKRDQEGRNYLKTSSDPSPSLSHFAREEPKPSSDSSNQYLSYFCNFLASVRANDIPLTGAAGNLEDQFNNSFTLERLSRSTEAIIGHPHRRSSRESDELSLGNLSDIQHRRNRCSSGRTSSEYDDRSSEDLSGPRYRRSRSPSERSRGEYYDREVPNPESDRDSEESLGVEGSEEESRVIYQPGTISTNNHLNWARLRRSFSGGMRSRIGQETLEAPVLPPAPLTMTAASLSMNGVPPLYPASVLPGVPGVPVPASPFVDGQQNPSFNSDVIARALAASHGSRKPRGEKKPIPDEQKDSRYYERRKKNNEAAKKSRDARKMREDEVAKQAEQLTKENAYLRSEIAYLREQIKHIRYDEELDQMVEKIKYIGNLLILFRHQNGF